MAKIRGIQSKIDKLTMALMQIGKIIKIQTQENYSMKFKKIFRTYKIIETTEEEIELKKRYYKLREEYKARGKPPDMLKKIQELKQEIDLNKRPIIEASNKIDVLQHLVGRYKELVE